MRRLIVTTLGAMVVAAACAQANAADTLGQPAEERALQQKLPQSDDGLWVTLRHTVVKEDVKTGMFTATHPPDVAALAGKTLTIRGFVLPYEAAETFRHFLLTRYTPVCAFCPPGAPNEVIDVTIATPVKWEDRLYTVTGTFAIQNDGEKGLFFRLDNATAK